jgi:hypothetical protein
MPKLFLRRLIMIQLITVLVSWTLGRFVMINLISSTTSLYIPSVGVVFQLE